MLARLADLRTWAGQPSLRTLRRLAGTTISPAGDRVDALPTSTTSYTLNGRGLPRPPRLEFVESFVTACLLACDHPRREIPEIVARWRVRWRALAMPGEPPPEPAAVPAQVPAQMPAAVPPMGGRRVSLLTAAACTLAGAAIGATCAVAALAQQRPPDTASPPPPAAGSGMRVLHQGTVPGMDDKQGFDADRGELTGQHIPGIDLSPWASGNHVVSKNSSLMAHVAAPAEPSPATCAGRPAEERTDQLRGLHGWEPGRGICLWTADGNMALLTLERTPSPADPVVAFRYTVWSPR